MADHTFEFLHHNEREEKPREKGITEIRGPYYDQWGRESSGTSWRR